MSWVPNEVKGCTRGRDGTPPERAREGMGARGCGCPGEEVPSPGRWWPGGGGQEVVPGR